MVVVWEQDVSCPQPDVSLCASPNTNLTPPSPLSNTDTFNQGDHIVTTPLSLRTPLANNINMEPAQPSAITAGSEGKKAQKKPVGSRKMKPRPSMTARYVQALHCTYTTNVWCRNLCAKVWCISNPRGSSAQFTLYWDSLNKNAKVVSPSHLLHRQQHMLTSLLDIRGRGSNGGEHISSYSVTAWASGRTASVVHAVVSGLGNRDAPATPCPGQGATYGLPSYLLSPMWLCWWVALRAPWGLFHTRLVLLSRLRFLSPS